MPLDSLHRALIPPFLRRFDAVPCDSEKSGIRPTWYAMFATPDRQGRRGAYLSDIDAARRRFEERFDGIWSFLYSCWREEDRRLIERAAPADSAGRKALTKVLDECESTHRVLESLGRLDVDALDGEVVLASTSRFRGDGIEPWLAPFEEEVGVRKFRDVFLTDVVWPPAGVDPLG